MCSKQARSQARATSMFRQRMSARLPPAPHTMCDLRRLALVALPLCCTLLTGTCTDETLSRRFGLVSAGCAAAYHRQLVTRAVPPRTYRYVHELEQDDDAISFRIVGGQRVSIEEVPYTILYGLYCGGALIAPDWAITAAHCTEKEQYVYLGSSQRSRATRHTICAHYTHPGWDAAGGTKTHSHDWDYQLLLLEEAVPVSAQARPVAIGSVRDVRPGRTVAVSGWGHTHYKDKMQDYLRRVMVPIMDQETCRSMPLETYRSITPRMFCAGLLNGSKDACQGDSGGPAVVSGRLVGLVSFGVGCAESMQPGVYANLPIVRPWIREVTALPL